MMPAHLLNTLNLMVGKYVSDACIDAFVDENTHDMTSLSRYDLVSLGSSHLDCCKIQLTLHRNEASPRLSAK